MVLITWTCYLFLPKTALQNGVDSHRQGTLLAVEIPAPLAEVIRIWGNPSLNPTGILQAALDGISLVSVYSNIMSSIKLYDLLGQRPVAVFLQLNLSVESPPKKSGGSTGSDPSLRHLSFEIGFLATSVVSRTNLATCHSISGG